LRLRDFFSTAEGWLFAVSGYDNSPRVRATLRYVPRPDGPRAARGQRYTKLEHVEALEFIAAHRPDYLGGVPPDRVTEAFRPADGLAAAARRDPRVAMLRGVLSPLPRGAVGITGSRLLGLEMRDSDIDLVVYGRWWEVARSLVERATVEGHLEPVGDELWRDIYRKRRPELPFEEFVLHERRKANRGALGGTYFDLLFTRGWRQVRPDLRLGPGRGVATIQARVTAEEFAFDSPSILCVEHPEVTAVVSYSHTYAGQALPGEVVEARGPVHVSPMGPVLVVGTTREARGEWVRSLTLLDGA